MTPGSQSKEDFYSFTLLKYLWSCYQFRTSILYFPCVSSATIFPSGNVLPRCSTSSMSNQQSVNGFPWQQSPSAHPQLGNVKVLALRHGEEAVEVEVVQEHVHRHASQRRLHNLSEDVHVGEDVHDHSDELGGETRRRRMTTRHTHTETHPHTHM